MGSSKFWQVSVSYENQNERSHLSTFCTHKALLKDFRSIFKNIGFFSDFLAFSTKIHMAKATTKWNMCVLFLGVYVDHSGSGANVHFILIFDLFSFLK